MLCPYCNEEVKDGAKKCKHCGEFFDDELRKGTKSSNNVGEFINYEGCAEVKRSFLQGDPKIECPKCGYRGKAKKIGANSDTVGCLLLLLGVIPGVIYCFVKGKGAYVCPQCGETHLRKTGSSIDLVGALLVCFGALMIIGIIVSGGGNGGTNRSTTRTTTTANQTVEINGNEYEIGDSVEDVVDKRVFWCKTTNPIIAQFNAQMDCDGSDIMTITSDLFNTAGTTDAIYEQFKNMTELEYTKIVFKNESGKIIEEKAL